jgi:hypothetical protein
MIAPGQVQKGIVLSGTMLRGPILRVGSLEDAIALLTADSIAVKTGDDLTVYINP